MFTIISNTDLQARLLLDDKFARQYYKDQSNKHKEQEKHNKLIFEYIDNDDRENIDKWNINPRYNQKNKKGTKVVSTYIYKKRYEYIFTSKNTHIYAETDLEDYFIEEINNKNYDTINFFIKYPITLKNFEIFYALIRLNDKSVMEKFINNFNKYYDEYYYGNFIIKKIYDVDIINTINKGLSDHYHLQFDIKEINDDDKIIQLIPNVNLVSDCCKYKNVKLIKYFMTQYNINVNEILDEYRLTVKQDEKSECILFLLIEYGAKSKSLQEIGVFLISPSDKLIEYIIKNNILLDVNCRYTYLVNDIRNNKLLNFIFRSNHITDFNLLSFNNKNFELYCELHKDKDKTILLRELCYRYNDYERLDYDGHNHNFKDFIIKIKYLLDFGVDKSIVKLKRCNVEIKEILLTY